VARGLVQTACTSLSVLFSSLGLTISALKSKVILYTRKHERPPLLISIGCYVLPQTTCFKYLGIFFDAGLRWSCHTEYEWRICLQRENLLKSVAGVLGSASILFDMARLYYEYGKETHADAEKGSVPGIEGCIGSDGIYTTTGRKIRSLELQIIYCSFLSIGPRFEEDAWSAGSALV
jgi:hypothetical protein